MRINKPECKSVNFLSGQFVLLSQILSGDAHWSFGQLQTQLIILHKMFEIGTSKAQIWLKLEQTKIQNSAIDLQLKWCPKTELFVWISDHCIFFLVVSEIKTSPVLIHLLYVHDSFGALRSL